MYVPVSGTTIISLAGKNANLIFLDVSNPNTVSGFLQFFDAGIGDISGITLGTTLPKFSIAIPKGASATDVGKYSQVFPMGLTFHNGIAVAATTALTGSSALGAALGVNIETRDVLIP